MDGSAVTPASSNIFQVNEECKKLDPEIADLFHRTAARLLFAAKRSRPDLQTAIAFLCTRVKNPDKEDSEKLKRVIRSYQGNGVELSHKIFTGFTVQGTSQLNLRNLI